VCTYFLAGFSNAEAGFSLGLLLWTMSVSFLGSCFVLHLKEQISAYRSVE